MGFDRKVKEDRDKAQLEYYKTELEKDDIDCSVRSVSTWNKNHPFVGPKVMNVLERQRLLKSAVLGVPGKTCDLVPCQKTPEELSVSIIQR